jgi:acyl-CoA synthetase (AMP-forming)/AMP-acid ligase II
VPKAAAVSHRLLSDRITRHLSVFGNRLANCSRIFCDVPISSSLGFQFLIYTLWRGGTMFFAGNSFEDTIRAFEQYKVQCMIASPGGLEVFLRGYGGTPGYQSNLELVFCGGDLLPKSLSERIRARMCSHLIAAYGSTEASMTATTYAQTIENIPGAVGFVTPGNVVQVVDDAGRILPYGREGLLRIRSEYAVSGYLNNPEESKKAFRDGWFYPGDFGSLDANNLLIITGREQSVLNVGGDKVNPETIERALTLLKGVIEVGAFTVPNDLGVNEIGVAIVTSSPLDERSVRDHCAARLPQEYVPALVVTLDRLPRNEMGKIDRGKLLDLAKRVHTIH